MRKKCPYSEFFWSVFFRIWTEYAKILCISPYSVQMRENMDQKNSQYGHSYAVITTALHYQQKTVVSKKKLLRVCVIVVK